MNLITRLRNIWKMSEYEPMVIGQELKAGDVVAPLVKPAPAPQIIKREPKDILDEFNDPIN